jgi:pimeloyl-ACP methyl ester carboxylesterase
MAMHTSSPASVSPSPAAVAAALPATPSRPPLPRERGALRLFRALSPRLPRFELPTPPPDLEPFEIAAVRRPGRPGRLAATWYPAAGETRGAVLLLPPWVPWGRSYFHRRGRVEALRAAGLGALAVDFPGFGDSGPPNGFFDRDVEDGLAELARRAPGLPLAVWGVSAGGYWAHPVLGRTNGVAAAFFEDVSPHLFEWSAQTRPLFRPMFLLFRVLFPSAYRFFDMRRHAEGFRVRRTAHVSGALDPGVRPEDTRELAARAGGRHLIVPGARHLESIKAAPAEVIGLAMATLRLG